MKQEASDWIMGSFSFPTRTQACGPHQAVHRLPENVGGKCRDTSHIKFLITFRAFEDDRPYREISLE